MKKSLMNEVISRDKKKADRFYKHYHSASTSFVLKKQSFKT